MKKALKETWTAMKKALAEIRAFINDNEKLTLVVIILGAGAFAFLTDRMYKVYGIEVYLAFAVLALLISIVVMVLNLDSNQVTRDALELTRLTTRPFLNLHNVYYNLATENITFEIHNTGALPGEGIAFQTDIYEPDSNEEPILTISEKLAVLFPGQDTTTVIGIGGVGEAAEVVRRLQVGEEIVMKIHIDYHSKESEGLFTERMYTFPPVGERQVSEMGVRFYYLAGQDRWA